VKTITIKCACCGAEAEKRKAEINRQIKKGRDYFFCSKECAVKNNSEKRSIHKDMLKNCLWCGIEFLSNTAKKAKKCCCKECASRYSQSYLNEQSRLKTSLKIKKAWADGAYIDMRVGKKTIARPPRNQECASCQKIFTTRKPNSKFCCRGCSAKGRIVKYDLNCYRRMAKFNFNLATYPEEFDFSLIKKFGWYSPTNKKDNLGGVSRDHIVSVKFGFINDIDPKIISHPANCQLLVHNENISKNHRSHMSLENLLLRIGWWEQKYSNHTLAEN
jgi:YHS domain-containing protein